MLAALLVVAMGISGPVARGADTSAVAVRRQSLELTIDPAAARWDGALRAWLDVRSATRYLPLRLHGPVTSRVEMNTAAGAVPLIFGMRASAGAAGPANAPGTTAGDTLLIETRAPLPVGPAGLSVTYADAFASATASAHGLVRTSAGVALRGAAGTAIPAWSGSPATPWALVIHVPSRYRVRTNLRLRDVSRQGEWRTWTFASTRALRAESLQVFVQPARPAAKH